MNYNEIGERHFNWVERMGWHNKSVLESIALIASEVGEAADESFGEIGDDKLGSELADIILRTVDLAQTTGFDVNAVVAKTTLNWRSKTLLESYAEIMVDVGRWVNSARKDELGPEFGEAMGAVVARVAHIAKENGFDLEAQIESKMRLNELRGTRGRKI